MNQVDEAAGNLLRLRERFVQKQAIVPAVLGVICGMSQAAFKRPDGVYVVPITALKS
jgi:hypothetical protein